MPNPNIYHLWPTKAGLRIVARLIDLRYIDMIVSDANVAALAEVVATIIKEERLVAEGADANA